LSTMFGYVGRDMEVTRVELNAGFKVKLSDCSHQNLKEAKNSEVGLITCPSLG
jgi:hypothetical protein